METQTQPEDPIEPTRSQSLQSTQSKPISATMEALQVEGGEAPLVRTKLRMAAILIALYLALFIAALDATIIATSVPTIAANLHSSSGYFWIGAAYLLANAAAAPIWAKGSDIWGRKPALLGAVVLFAASSLLAARSGSMKMLIAARALQGTAGGGLIQLVNITVSDLFSMRSRSLYLGLVEVMWAVAGGLGPVLGGLFTQLVSWRWCFYINLPVSGITFVLLLLFLDVHNPKTKLLPGLKAIDWFGTFSMLAVTLLLLLGLDFGGATFPWSSPTVICLIVFGTVMIGFFLFSEKRLAKYPLMPLSMFRDRSNNAAVAVGFAHGMTFIVAEYYLPLYFQSVKSASPLRSGVLILPITVSEATIGILTGVLIHQTGRYRELTWIGMTLLTIGTGLYIHLDRTSSLGEVVAFELIGGMGAGFLFESPLIAVQVMVSQADTASATATFAFIRTTAMAIAIVVGGVVFQNGMASHATSLHAAGLNTTLVDAFTGGNAGANVELIRHIGDVAQRHAVQDAFAGSLRYIWVVFVIICGLGLCGSLGMRHKELGTEHTETRTGIEKLTKRESS